MSDKQTTFWDLGNDPFLNSFMRDVTKSFDRKSDYIWTSERRGRRPIEVLNENGKAIAEVLPGVCDIDLYLLTAAPHLLLALQAVDQHLDQTPGLTELKAIVRAALRKATVQDDE